MNQDQFAARFALRMLHMRQNLNARLGLIKDGLDGPAALAIRPGPEISRESCQMSVLEEGIEVRQVSF